MSGVIAGLVGWRGVFVFAAVVMLLLAALLRVILPLVPTTERMGYGALLRSVASLVRAEPVPRQRMALGALSFGCFSVLWTALAFLLSGPHYGYGNTVIGLFGLAGVAGASIAPVAGRLSAMASVKLNWSSAEVRDAKLNVGLESAVTQANASDAPDDDEERSTNDGEQDEEPENSDDAEMTERFRGFGSEEPESAESSGSARASARGAWTRPGARPRTGPRRR